MVGGSAPELLSLEGPGLPGVLIRVRPTLWRRFCRFSEKRTRAVGVRSTTDAYPNSSDLLCLTCRAQDSRIQNERVNSLSQLLGVPVKRTYQPNERRRAKKHGFRHRMSDRAGQAIVKARRRKGRHRLSA